MSVPSGTLFILFHLIVLPNIASLYLTGLLQFCLFFSGPVRCSMTYVSSFLLSWHVQNIRTCLVINHCLLTGSLISHRACTVLRLTDENLIRHYVDWWIWFVELPCPRNHNFSLSDDASLHVQTAQHSPFWASGDSEMFYLKQWNVFFMVVTKSSWRSVVKFID